MNINDLINKIIEEQKTNTKKDIEFCCGKCNFSDPVNIIETDKIKIIYSDDGVCEIRRKKNDNPVIMRDKNQKIFRQHAEWSYLKYEMYKLAGLNKETELLNDNIKYD